jgi:hypothetical protein
MWAKNPIKIDGRNHHMEEEREGQRKAKRCIVCRNQNGEN